MSAGFLLDTNVLSEFNHAQPPAPKVKEWVASIHSDSLYISIVTLWGIRLGIELRDPSKGRTELEHWLEHDLHIWFEGRILGLDERIGNIWAWMTAQRQRQGKPLAIRDGLIAATGFEHDLTVVSRDRDFIGLAIQTLNPWEA